MGYATYVTQVIGAGPVELRFDFAGGTNMDPAKDAHLHSGRVTLRDANLLEAEWAVYEKGKQTGPNRFFLNRVKAAAAAAAARRP